MRNTVNELYNSKVLVNSSALRLRTLPLGLWSSITSAVAGFAGAYMYDVCTCV